MSLLLHQPKGSKNAFAVMKNKIYLKMEESWFLLCYRQGVLFTARSFYSTFVLLLITVIFERYKPCAVQAGLLLFSPKRACTKSHRNSLFPRWRA